VQSIEEIRRNTWEYIVIGTGVGGATAGYALARAGRSVLFLEKGHALFDRHDALRGRYPELELPPGAPPLATPGHAPLLALGGRFFDEIEDQGNRFVPFLGCGTGGSSALYGMAMERFFPADFEPRKSFPVDVGASLPDAWPIAYDDLSPFYAQAEGLYRVRGQPDPLRPGHPDLLPPRKPSAPNAELSAHFGSKGLHPYRLPLACEAVADCQCCQGYLCDHDCKNDAARICLEPAIRNHGARLLDACEVVRLEATADEVSEVICHHGGQTFGLRAARVILAAGALGSPALLLRSKNDHWPRGLANGSGLVGRNLMRHCVDLYLVFTRASGPSPMKELAFSDLYQFAGTKLGTVQSFGMLPPAPILMATVGKELHDAAPWLSPLFNLVRPIAGAALAALLRRGVLLAAIMEDLPYADNRITPGPPLGIQYRLHDPDRIRLATFRKQVGQALKPYRYLPLHQAEKNTMLAHACGTCRFGDDPASSVLDRFNRAHEVDNLYVVDGSFFPSSAGTNPALTIAANALRVAERLLRP